MSETYEDDTLLTCPKCGSDDVEWEQCHQCFGEGCFDLYEEDPINFAPDQEYEDCSECDGKGGYIVCRACQAAAGAGTRGKG